jgi:hypothetical protein
MRIKTLPCRRSGRRVVAGNADTVAYCLEAKYKLTPPPHTQIKLQYSFQYEENAAQFTLRF